MKRIANVPKLTKMSSTCERAVDKTSLITFPSEIAEEDSSVLDLTLSRCCKELEHFAVEEID